MYTNLQNHLGLFMSGRLEYKSHLFTGILTLGDFAESNSQVSPSQAWVAARCLDVKLLPPPPNHYIIIN